jgi:hypothetical protein
MTFPGDTVPERNAKRNYSPITAPHFFCHPEASEESGCCSLAHNDTLNTSETIMGFHR